MLKFLFVVFLLVFPVMMLFYSAIMKRAANKNHRHSFGFISASARQSDDTWKFANKFASGLFRVVGLFLLFVSVILSLISCIFIKSNEMIINIFSAAIIAEAALIIACVFAVTFSIYKKFGDLPSEKDTSIDSEKNNNK